VSVNNFPVQTASVNRAGVKVLGPDSTIWGHPGALNYTSIIAYTNQSTAIPGTRACYRHFIKRYIGPNDLGTYIGFGFNVYGGFTISNKTTVSYTPNILPANFGLMKLAGALMGSDGERYTGSTTGLPLAILGQSAPTTWATAMAQLSNAPLSNINAAMFQFATPVSITTAGLYWLQIIQEIGYCGSFINENLPAIESYGVGATPISNDSFGWGNGGFYDAGTTAGPISGATFEAQIPGMSAVDFNYAPPTNYSAFYTDQNFTAQPSGGEPTKWVPYLWAS